MEKLKERVKDLNTRADSAQKILGAHTNQLVDQERHLKQHEAKLGDLEGRSWRNNVLILGVPEGKEYQLNSFWRHGYQECCQGWALKKDYKCTEHVEHLAKGPNLERHPAC
ncbi:hypothetical protein NDU88_008087 [Pleurodeles waltl]|uniref:Uncharacterized protein n=1 Tax=Pleurodeles waltl TaxID=8319 RepID=A0AAV7RUS7_PLEWA|nr:hypothetical protein NDU88_008087 [Pleurodeles waltl]